jgi:hypothetical protein
MKLACCIVLVCSGSADQTTLKWTMRLKENISGRQHVALVYSIGGADPHLTILTTDENAEQKTYMGRAR